jgi:GNAT superfamily N-acetyltransferase
VSSETAIRPMREEDLTAVLAIDRAVGWSHDEARFRYLLADGESRGLVAEGAGTLAGFALVGVREPVGWLGALAVDPAWQGRGIGMALGRAADTFFRESDGCDTAVLEAYETNRRAIDIYDRLGFVVTGANDLCGTPRGEAPIVPDGEDAEARVAREVVPLTEADLPFLYALDDSYYGGWREQDLIYWLGQGPDLARLLRVDGQPVGYCLVERATGRLGPAAAPTLSDFLCLLDDVLRAMPHGPEAPPYAASLRIANPDAAVLGALAGRNLHPVPALRNVRMEKVYRRPLRQLPGYYVSARPEKG